MPSSEIGTSGPGRLDPTACLSGGARAVTPGRGVRAQKPATTAVLALGVAALLACGVNGVGLSWAQAPAPSPVVEEGALPPPSRLKSGLFRRDPNGALVFEAAPERPPSHPAAPSPKPLPAVPGSTVKGSGKQQPAASVRVATRDLAAGQLRVCPADRFVADCEYDSLSAALADARPNGLIVMALGLYEQAAVVDVPGVTIRGEAGAHLHGKAARGKAALVVTANDVVIEGLECSGIAVRDLNGACIRIEGDNLTVRDVYFHDNQDGILSGPGGGTLVIENSRFERNGFGGYSHGVYIGSSIDHFIFRNNQILSTKGGGHGLKSRAQRTTIEGNMIAGLDGQDSRAIDIPNGGGVIIRNNLLQKGPNSENSEIIGLTLEGPSNNSHSTLIENNIIVFDRIFLPTWKQFLSDILRFDSAKKGRLLRSKSPGRILFRDNIVVGTTYPYDDTAVHENTRAFRDRDEAGLAPYPALPPIGSW